ncbi:hypothetical protein [Enterococcus hermanniensis]|uniref:Transglycosylase n=1 Tax=Enterococcus hermanniensis TaxID=249189 RepID=A0A1L8TR18_9ENTE|nr:hypothetical protein [Enterococcus hermanniensis]OJG46673.1 hypothetical protein RV04_GL001101 [Enterococcus hermanniensis]
MMTIIFAILIGAVMGWLWTLLVSKIRGRSTNLLLGINSIFGALGAVSANQLLVYGPDLLDLSIIPTIVGAIVLSIVVTYGYFYATNKLEKIRNN